MRIFKTLAVLVVAGLANLAVWSLPNQPVPLDPPPGGKLKSVSFAPFRDGQSPLTHSFPTPEQIEEDLAALAPQVAGVRTYTSLEGLEVVPELARKHGLTVTMGAWLSSKTDKNEQEIASRELKALAKTQAVFQKADRSELKLQLPASEFQQRLQRKDFSETELAAFPKIQA